MKKVFLLILSLFILFPTLIFAKNKQVSVSFSKCVDGDTAKFMLNDKEITVRFLAIDTPETKHPTKGVEAYGKEASAFTCNTIKKATSIVLEYDDGSSKFDKYNRHLAWVFVDNVLLQDVLIQKGFAKVAYLYGDYTYTEQLQKQEIIAKEQQLGIWNNEIPKKENYGFLILIIVCIAIIYLIYPNGRKKINRKIKSQLKKEIKKRLT